jgi:hypothetical protein
MQTLKENSTFDTYIALPKLEKNQYVESSFNI